MFTASCLSNDDLSQSGFSSKREAESYIVSFICEECNKDLQQGYQIISYEDDSGEEVTEQYEINSPINTDCGAEWLIMTDEEYNSSESIEDLFIAGGLEPDEETEEKLTFEQKMNLKKKREENK